MDDIVLSSPSSPLVSASYNDIEPIDNNSNDTTSTTTTTATTTTTVPPPQVKRKTTTTTTTATVYKPYLSRSPHGRKFPYGNEWLRGLIIPPPAPYSIAKFDPKTMSKLEWLAFPKVHGNNKVKTPKNYIALRTFLVDYTTKNPKEFISPNKMKDLIQELFPGQVVQAYQIYTFLVVLGAVHYKLVSEDKQTLMNQAKVKQEMLFREVIPPVPIRVKDNKKRKRFEPNFVEAAVDINDHDDMMAIDNKDGNGDDGVEEEEEEEEEEEAEKQQPLQETSGTRSSSSWSPPAPKRLKDIQDEMEHHQKQLSVLSGLAKRPCIANGCGYVGTLACWICDEFLCAYHYHDREGCVENHLKMAHSVVLRAAAVIGSGGGAATTTTTTTNL